MTHDELTHKLICFAEMSDIGKQQRALLAVVELHKPRKFKAGNWCVGCNADYEYPCPTIQAIEKELS